MSANLKWEPSNRKAYDLPDALKFVLDRAGKLDRGRVTMGGSNLPYLQGLKDAGIEGAQELIDAIQKYETVELWLEY